MLILRHHGLHMRRGALAVAGWLVVAGASVNLSMAALAVAQEGATCGMVETQDGPQFFGPCPGQQSRAPVMTGTWYAAIAKSSSRPTWGASWHEASLAAAQRSALGHCNQQQVTDCKVVMTGVNNCLSLAESAGTGAWGAATSELGREDAILIATQLCRKNHGADCAAVVTPCARQPANSKPCLTVGPGIDTSHWSAAALANLSPEVRKRFANRAAYTNGACR